MNGTRAAEVTQRQHLYPVRVTDQPETHLGRITPEHIRQAEANLLRRQRSRRDVGVDLVFYLGLAVAQVMLGALFSYGVQHDQSKVCVLAVVGMVSMFASAIAAGSRRR